MFTLHIAQTLCDLLTDIIGIVKFVKVIVSITCIPFFSEPGDSGWQVTSLRVDNSIPFFRELGDSGWLAIGLLVDSSIYILPLRVADCPIFCQYCYVCCFCFKTQVVLQIFFRLGLI